MIIVIGILYYAKCKRVKASRMPNLTRITPSKDDIELQMYSLMTTNDKEAKDLQNNPEPSTSKATPLLIQKWLEEEFGVDFSSYEKYQKFKQERLRKGSNQLNTIV